MGDPISHLETFSLMYIFLRPRHGLLDLHHEPTIVSVAGVHLTLMELSWH